jgi:radical SAM superfamily enzyme YgiQ (UPF0313 family)
MRILLVWPSQPHIISPPHMKVIQEGLGYLPPIGLICLATWLRERSEHQAEVLDALLEGMSPEEVARHAVATGAQAVGLSGMTHTWMDCLLLARAIRAAAPQLPIILGGPHATLFPMESLEHSEVDYVVVGDGEVPLTSLLDRLAQGREDTDGLPGVLRRGDPAGSRYVHPDMADLPIPDRSLTPWRRYASVVSRRPPTTVVMSSRGCPYRCSFCSTAGGKKFRANPAHRVVDELEHCVGLGIREFLFFDELFTFDRSRVLEICRQIRERGLDVFWDVRSRVDRVDPEMLRAMAAAGCQRVQYGIESGTERVLGLYTKDMTPEQARQAVRWTREAGISTYADFMIGAPGETREEILETLRFAHSLDLDFVHFSITMLLPRTRLYAQALRQGLLARDVWREYVLEPTEDFHPPYWEEVLDASELEALLRQAIRSFYFSPRFLWRSLASLRSPGELLRKARAGLKLALGL